MSARVIPLAAVAPKQRAYDRMCDLRRALVSAVGDWAAGDEMPSEADIQAEVFATCSAVIQVVEMVRPKPVVVPPPEAHWPQGEDWGDVFDAVAGGHDAGWR